MALRLRVVGGGCAGFSYDLYFDEPAEVDRQFESHGVKCRRRRDEPDVPGRHRDRLRRGPAGRRLQVQQPEREVDLRLRLVVLASSRRERHRRRARARARLGRRRSARATSGSTTTAATRARCPSSYPPECAVLCATTEQVAAVLRICAEHKVPVTPRGAGSGMCGGALPIARRRRAVDREDAARSRRSTPAISSRVVEPGVVTGELQDAVEAQGLFYPPDPASLEFCSIGGNAATNAGGPRAFKYGVTREYVLGLEVGADGRRGAALRPAHREGRHRLRPRRRLRRHRGHVRRDHRADVEARAASRRPPRPCSACSPTSPPPAPRSRRCCAAACGRACSSSRTSASIDHDPRRRAAIASRRTPARSC